MHKVFAILASLFLTLPPVFAQTKQNSKVTIVSSSVKQITRLNGSILSFAEIDQTIQNLMQAGHVTGLGLTVINDNKIAFIKTYGYKNTASKELIDTATVFYGASFSKAVFAYLVMQLIQEGKLELDKTIWSYLNKPLPLYSGYNNLVDDDRWKLITVRHCLTHTTGFPNWRWLNPKGNKKLELFFTPGERFAYSGEGLVLLQLAVEETTGKSLEQLAQERIFKPFGMTRTSYLWQSAFESNYAKGYDEKGDELEKRKRTVANAAGSLETTLADYSRFIQAVMQGKGLDEKTKQEMITPQVAIRSKHQFPSLNTDTLEDTYKNIDLSYGLGWGYFKCAYGTAFFKEGHDDGWEHYNVNFPDKKTSIIIMSNSSNAESIFKETLEKIIGDDCTPYEWENYTPYGFLNIVSKPVEIPKPAAEPLSQYVGVYIADTVKAIISLENGQLQIELEKGGMPKTEMHMEKPDLFSLKLAAIEIQFERNDKGDIEKLVMKGSNEQHEFKKIEQ